MLNSYLYALQQAQLLRFQKNCGQRCGVMRGQNFLFRAGCGVRGLDA